MQGFLDAGPHSTQTQVQQVACKAKGQAHCAYHVAYQS